jgi:hypothetical protein
MLVLKCSGLFFFFRCNLVQLLFHIGQDPHLALHLIVVRITPFLHAAEHFRVMKYGLVDSCGLQMLESLSQVITHMLQPGVVCVCVCVCVCVYGWEEATLDWKNEILQETELIITGVKKSAKCNGQ